MKKTLMLIVVMLLVCSMIVGHLNITFASNDVQNAEENSPVNNEGNEPNNNQEGDPGQIPDDGRRTFTVNFGDAEWNVDGTKVTAAVWGIEINNGPVQVDEKEDIKLDNFNSETMQILVSAEDGFSTTLFIEGDRVKLENTPEGIALPDLPLAFWVELKPAQEQNSPSNPEPNNNENNENNNNENNNNSPIVPAPEPGNEPQPGGEEELEFDIEIKGTNANLWINGLPVLSDENGVIMHEFKGSIKDAGTTNPNETNQIKFCPHFGSKDIKEYIINDIVYTKEDAIGLGEDGIDFEIPGAEKYTIRVVVDEDSEEVVTIIWTNPNYVPKDADDEEWIQEFKLEHGSGFIREVYDEEGRLVDPNEYLQEDSVDNGVGDNGFGFAFPKPGYRVVFQFIPEYGYQLTDIKSNGQSIGIGEKINEFEFIMPDTNVHFDAVFSKTDDIIRSESNKVISGTLILTDDALESGTAQLTVKDISLDKNKIKEFEEVSSKYEIQNYLDIDLYQVFFKGKDDIDDVWANQIDELENEAEISFKLQDGIKAKDVVIVHNIHNGDEYEVIEIDSYDEETNTITFKTKSFSSYAIATKKENVQKNNIKLIDEKTKAIIEFVDEDGNVSEDFSFIIMDLTKISEEEIESLGITKAEYDMALEMIKEDCEKIGKFIILYNIEVVLNEKDRSIQDGPFTIKIPYTDDLKEFDSFVLAYISDEDFSISETIELKLDGDYLVGTLKHLSPYVLIGKTEEIEKEVEKEIAALDPEKGDTSGVDTPKAESTKTEEPTINYNNPTTGDNIIIYASIFVLSAIAIAFELFYIKKGKSNK